MANYRSLEITITDFKGHYTDIETALYADVIVVTPPEILTSGKAIIAKCRNSEYEWEPESNRKFRFIVEESKIHQNSARVGFHLRSKRTLMIDEAVGHLSVPLKPLWDNAAENNGSGSGHFGVSGFGKHAFAGFLSFCYKFAEENSIIIRSDEDDDDVDYDEDEDDCEDSDDYAMENISL